MEAENQQSEGQNMLKREEDSKSLEGDVTSVMVLGHKLDCPKFTEQIERSEEIIEIHYD